MIRLVRGKGFVDSARKYKVLLDGREIGRIKRNQTFEYEPEMGDHTLELAIDWCKSPSLPFAYVGERIEFTCRPGAKPWNALFKALFQRKQYIVLERA